MNRIQSFMPLKVFLLGVASMLFRSDGFLKAQAVDCIEVAKYKNEQHTLNDAYKKKIKDFKAGYYCSLCHKAKSEFEAMGKSFEEHLEEVQGEPVPATQEMYAEAYDDYSNEFDRLDNQIKEAQKQCQESWQQEQDRLAQELEMEMERERQAYEARKQEFIEQQTELIEAKREQRREIYQQAEEALQNILNSYQNSSFGTSMNDVINSTESIISTAEQEVNEWLEQVDFESELNPFSDLPDFPDEYSNEVIDIIETLGINEELLPGQWGIIKGIGINGEKAVNMVDSFLDAFMDPSSQLTYDDMNREIDEYISGYFVTILEEYVKDLIPGF